VPRECAGVCVGGSLHNLFVVSGASGVGEGRGARQETKSHEKKGRQTVDKEELVTREGGGDLGVGVTVLSTEQTCVRIRETREGWPQLSVETEANGNSWNTYERSPSLAGSLDSSCRYNRFLSSLGCSSQPSKKYYFPNRKLFYFFSSPISSHRPKTWAPGQIVVLGRQSRCLDVTILCVYPLHTHVACHMGCQFRKCLLPQQFTQCSTAQQFTQCSPAHAVFTYLSSLGSVHYHGSLGSVHYHSSLGSVRYHTTVFFRQCSLAQQFRQCSLPQQFRQCSLPHSSFGSVQYHSRFEMNFFSHSTRQRHYTHPTST
jgi:hypothetical protein